MRYPTRAFQSDTTVVSNDRRRHHRVSQTKAAPAPTGAAFTYPLDRSAYISGSDSADRDGSGAARSAASSVIDELVREGAQRMLAEALRAEVEAYIAQFADVRDE